MGKQKKIPNENREKIKRIEIKAPIEKISGVYTNRALIHHSKYEFILDFIFDMMGEANLVSRVITNPFLMKKLYEAIGENISKYEEKFGKIIKDDNK